MQGGNKKRQCLIAALSYLFYSSIIYQPGLFGAKLGLA